jgi:hypothetical protein
VRGAGNLRQLVRDLSPGGNSLWPQLGSLHPRCACESFVLYSWREKGGRGRPYLPRSLIGLGFVASEGDGWRKDLGDRVGTADLGLLSDGNTSRVFAGEAPWRVPVSQTSYVDSDAADKAATVVAHMRKCIEHGSKKSREASLSKNFILWFAHLPLYLPRFVWKRRVSMEQVWSVEIVTSS